MKDHDAKRMIDELFGSFESKKKVEPPKTTDKPNIELFMLQMIRHYGGLASGEGMVWNKTFRDKVKKDEYTINIELKRNLP